MKSFRTITYAVILSIAATVTLTDSAKPREKLSTCQDECRSRLLKRLNVGRKIYSREKIEYEIRAKKDCDSCLAMCRQYPFASKTL